MIFRAADHWRLVDAGGQSSICKVFKVARAVQAFDAMADVQERGEHELPVATERVEEQLQQHRKVGSVDQFTGGVAHDVNNLLMVVSGNLELIAETVDHTKIWQFAAAAQRAVDRCVKLIAQLVAFSRGQTLSLKLTNVNRLISEFQELVRQAVGEGCAVRLSTDEQPCECHVDPSFLEAALLNLALNGRDAMPNGGSLEIEARNVVLHERDIGGCLPGSYVRLSVSDTGSGMSPEIRDRVFEPFFTTKEVGKGTGLGLSMVHSFVRQCSGHIDIESAPGAGTTVALYFPKPCNNGSKSSIASAPLTNALPVESITALGASGHSAPSS